MLNLPEPPPTRITRQLTCVSCKETFFISEDDPVNNRTHTSNNSGNGNGNNSEPDSNASDNNNVNEHSNWQMPINGAFNIQLRYQEDRTQRSVISDSHAQPQQTTYKNWEDLQREHINCPRCGADNRNWLNLLNPISGSGRLIWTQRFPAAFKGIVFSIILLLIVFIAWSNTNISGMSTPRKTTLLAFVLIAAALPALELTKSSHWLDLRNDRHLRQLGQANGVNKEVGLWLRGFLLFLICTFIIPVVLFLYGPRGMNFLTRIFFPAPTAVVENAAAPYINMLNEQLNEMPDDVADLTYDTIRRLEDIPYPWAYASAVENILDEFNQDLEEILEDLADSTQPDTMHQITTLQTAVDQAILEINRAQDDAIQTAITETSGTVRFLALWVMLVGVSGITSVFASMAALKSFTSHVDNVLPPPIFYSVANMTRVVVWEAKQALEVKVAVDHIQWTAVNRNQQGGITLQGLHYDSNLPHPIDNTLQTRVLAQRYEIISDCWGRIIEAKVKPTRALLPSRGSTLGDELFRLPPHVPTESRLNNWP